MYQVLLVDDEPSVTNSLKQWIPWEQFDMQIAATVSNGEDALAVISRMTIHVVITDIRMQGMGGLELCQTLYMKYPDILIMIMSGYAEFSYAQKAFKYGILGYCLKPLEYDEICLHLNRALSRLRSKESILSQDDFLNAVLDGNINSIKQFLESVHFYHTSFYVAVATTDSPLSVPQGLIIRVARREFAYLTAVPLTGKILRHFALNTKDECVGVCADKITAEQLPDMISECQTFAHQNFIDPAARVCYGVQAENANILLKEMIYFQAPNQLIGHLEKIKSSPDIKNSFTLKTALQLCNTVLSVNPFMNEPDDYYIYSTDELIKRYITFDNLLSSLIQSLAEIKLPLLSADKLSNQSFLKMMNYLTTHYHEEISLSDIAAMLHINSSYLSQIFKKETGTTFSKYLTDLRITKAKQLLQQSSLSISDVAMKTGFNDYFYFLRIFKKITGQTPSQYRME